MLTDNAINAVSEYTVETPIQKLYRLKALYSKEELNDEEKDEIAILNDELDVVNEALNDKQLCNEMLSFLYTTGINCNALLFGAVGLADYVIERYSPNDCGYDVFNDWWIASCYFNGTDMIDRAISRTIDFMIAEENAKSVEKEN